MNYKLDAVRHRLQRLLVQHGDIAVAGTAEEVQLIRNLWVHNVEAPLKWKQRRNITINIAFKKGKIVCKERYISSRIIASKSARELKNTT